MAHVQPDLELQAPGESALQEGRPSDDALLSLLASMAASDGVMHNAELDFLLRVRRGMSRDEVQAWAQDHGPHPVDPVEVAAAIVEPDERWKCLRFAARMAWKDGELQDEERDLLDRLEAAMALPPGAVDRVLREMSPHAAERFTSSRILKCLVEAHWDAVQLASGDLVSEDLHAVHPADSEVVARVGLEKVEVMALATHGIVARFLEGPAFLHWADVVTYTRGRSLGSALELHTEDGASYGLVDSRLAGLARVLDRLLDADGKRRKGGAPTVEHIRGE